jgi:hypothetical protein
MLRPAIVILAAFSALAALAATACSTSSGSSGSSDGGPDCVPHDGSYTCLGATSPVCPSSAQQQQPCDGTLPSCMGCSQGAGFTCSCRDAGAGATPDASLWLCIGTEHTCE